MRVDDLRFKIAELASKGPLANHFTSERISGTLFYYINELPELRSKLEDAMSLPVLAQMAEKIYTSQPLRFATESVQIESSFSGEFKAIAAKLDLYLRAMLETLDFLARGGEGELAIKLPPVSELSTVVAKLEKLEKVFAQALSILSDPPTLKVAKWEKGSLWIDLLIGSTAGVTLIGGVTWAAACAYKKFQEGRLLEKTSEGLGIKNEVLASLRDGIAFAIEAEIQAEAKRLDEKHSKGKGDPETIKRLQYCIRETFEMIKEGTEIHPALMAPEDVKNVFPNMSEILALPSTQKLLKDHADNGGDAST
jgi:hypothetical protein